LEEVKVRRLDVIFITKIELLPK